MALQYEKNNKLASFDFHSVLVVRMNMHNNCTFVRKRV
jgi:hypothetical protein